MLLTRSVPRLAPATVRRARLERWLTKNTPLRLIVAPPGMGKTTLVLQRLADVPLGAYCAVPEDASPEDLLVALGSALGLPQAPSSYVELLLAMRRIAATQPLEIAIDDLDRAGSEARAMAMKLVDNLPENVSLIYCSRTREAVDVKHWLTRGLGALCDARRLAFDVAEIAALADVCGVTYSNAELARLLEESDGWAIVVGGAVRAAADDERSLGDAYERWRGLYGEVFLDFIVAETERAEPEDGALVRALMNGNAIADPAALHRLEARGLFVLNDNGVMRPFKALQQARAIPVDINTSIPMVVRMLGRFSVSIHGRDVEWVRRRDAQIIKYLLVCPGASATRAELIAKFWPRVEKQLAAQSIRTACSHIRKAIANIVGYARVDRYFRASTTIVLDLSSVVTDAGRFTAHAMAGDAAYNAGDFDEAARYYQSAEKIYAGRLYGEDALEPWFEQSAAAFETRLGIILERLAEYTFAKGDMKHAAEYAYRAKLIRPDQQGVLRMLAGIGGHAPPA